MKYTVVTREYSYIEPCLDDGSGPTYDTCDVVYIEASNKKEAKILAVKELRKTRSKFLEETMGENPFGGMKVLPFCDESKEN